MKLGEIDVGQLLACLGGTIPMADLVHVDDRANTTTTRSFKVQRPTEKFPKFSIRMVQSSAGESRQLTIYLDFAEATLLYEFMRSSANKMLGF
jgi:hypothetical protein